MTDKMWKTIQSSLRLSNDPTLPEFYIQSTLTDPECFVLFLDLYRYGFADIAIRGKEALYRTGSDVVHLCELSTTNVIVVKFENKVRLYAVRKGFPVETIRFLLRSNKGFKVLR